MNYVEMLVIRTLFCSAVVAAPEPVTCESPSDCHGEGRWSVKTDALTSADRRHRNSSCHTIRNVQLARHGCADSDAIRTHWD
jgi:hypothetical protein